MNSHRIGRTFTAAEICNSLSAELIGDPERTVQGSNFLERATKNELSFVGCRKNIKRIAESAAVVIIAPKDAASELPDDASRSFILVEEPEAAFLETATKITPPRKLERVGVSSKASVAPTAVIGAHTSVRDFAVVGEDVQIGDNCDIGSGAVIYDGCVIGDNVVLGPNVVLYSNNTIGSDVQIEAGTVIGGDGFGYRTVNGGHEWLPHIGTVNICDDVRIGSCSVIDRAKMGETRIGSGTRIDNLVVIAHNCQIGEHNILVSQTGIAGSVATGSYVVMAGQTGIADHVTIGDQAVIGAKSGVHRDMPGGETYLGAPAGKATEVVRQLTALTRLPEIRTSVKEMQKQIDAMQARLDKLLDEKQPAKDAA